MSDRAELVHELIARFRETLNLEHLQSAVIEESTQLIGGELGIDSIDILELVVMLEQSYGVRIDSKETGQQVFQTFGTLADHVARHRTR